MRGRTARTLILTSTTRSVPSFETETCDFEQKPRANQREPKPLTIVLNVRNTISRSSHGEKYLM